MPGETLNFEKKLTVNVAVAELLAFLQSRKIIESLDHFLLFAVVAVFGLEKRMFLRVGEQMEGV